MDAKKNGPLYQLQYEENPRLLWDTKRLFSLIPKTKSRQEVQLGAGVEAFVFQSAPYGEKLETWTFAAMGTPSTPKPLDGYPAVVLIHGGDGYVFGEWIEYWTKRGFVAIAVDMFGNQLNEKLEKAPNPDGGHPEYHGSNFDSVETPEQSWVYHSVYNVIMAHNLLRNRADVDSRRIALTGISWGGYVTSIVAGVDHRFAAFAPTYGCGFVYDDGFWTNGNGEFGGAGNLQKWVDLYDPSSYLPYAVKPTLFVSGVDDPFFSVVNRMKSAGLIKGKAFYSQRADLPHGHCWDLTHEIESFFRHVLYGENTYATICECVVNDGVATLKTDGKPRGLATFVYTTSTDQDSHKWTWNKAAVCDGGNASCVIPDGATAYFFERAWEKNGIPMYQSTPVYFVEKK